MFFQTETNLLILKFVWKGTGARIASTFLKNKNQMGGITLANIMAYNIAIQSRQFGVGREIDT